MTGPAYVLVWCTASEGIKNAYYSDTDEGRALLKKDLGLLSGPLVYFVRVYREATESVVAQLRGQVDCVVGIKAA